ncbi:hypothetical protein ACHHYP_13602 [Achlya hypogyna]|uniref:Secreted protein n=1 Tax=Achlya hypogyna TaxID=1202772 RepID=A0A1V9ZFQ0_ACHHY|nr:hypothetical protein ACHHYP_13602 [Achlya hypogyna]
MVPYTAVAASPSTRWTCLNIGNGKYKFIDYQGNYLSRCQGCVANVPVSFANSDPVFSLATPNANSGLDSNTWTVTVKP